jgi:probable HAF family extracellular repeat protein
LNFRPAFALFLALTLQAVLPAALHAAFSYTVTDLGTLGGADSSASAVNASGQVVGKAMLPSGSYRAFAWWKGTMIDLGTLGGTYSAATGINDQAQVVGEANISGDSQTHAFVFSFVSGVMTDLGTLGGNYSTAAAINNNDVVVGTSKLSNGNSRAFGYWNGVMYDLGTLGGDDYSTATAIDDSNVIVGSAARASTGVFPVLYNKHGFAFINGQMLDLSIFGGLFNISGTPTYPLGVSDTGVVGAFSTDPLGDLGPCGFVCYPGQTPIRFGDGGDNLATEEGINALGQAVGWYESTLVFQGTSYASLYSGGVLYDLNTLVDLSGSNFSHLSDAAAISNTGYIVGTGTTKNGNPHAYLLTPILAP